MDNQETANPFQATFPPSAPTASPPAALPETTPLATGKNGRKRQTQSAPITRPRKTASKKASAPKAGKAKRGRPPKPAHLQVADKLHEIADAVKPAKRGRPAAVAGKRANGSLKIELGAALNAMAGLKPEDAVLLGQIVTELLKKPKAARSRIMGAIIKVLP